VCLNLFKVFLAHYYATEQSLKSVISLKENPQTCPHPTAGRNVIINGFLGIAASVFPACRQTGGNALNMLHIPLLSFFSCQDGINILLFSKGF